MYVWVAENLRQKYFFVELGNQWRYNFHSISNEHKTHLVFWSADIVPIIKTVYELVATVLPSIGGDHGGRCSLSKGEPHDSLTPIGSFWWRCTGLLTGQVYGKSIATSRNTNFKAFSYASNSQCILLINVFPKCLWAYCIQKPVPKATSSSWKSFYHST